MLEAGADPTISNKEGKSPIDMAADNKYDQLAKQLETRIVFAVSTCAYMYIYIHVCVLILEWGRGCGR